MAEKKKAVSKSAPELRDSTPGAFVFQDEAHVCSYCSAITNATGACPACGKKALRPMDMILEPGDDLRLYLRQWIEVRGWTIQQVAGDFGVSREAIYQTLSGARPLSKRMIGKIGLEPAYRAKGPEAGEPKGKAAKGKK